MGNSPLPFPFDQFKDRPVRRGVVIDLQSFAGQFADQFVNRGRLVQLHELPAPAIPVSLRRATYQGQQFLAHLYVEEIKVEVILVEFPHRALVMEIMDRLVVAVAHLHQVGRQLVRFLIAMT